MILRWDVERLKLIFVHLSHHEGSILKQQNNATCTS